ncbi:MAG: DNA translocase FtsK, partial [Clostridiales bacterium]|nr:DNA translocase FtsK [Clostridiales bacterium]
MNEVKFLALAAVGILFLIAMFFPESMGVFGRYSRNVLFGFFGYGAFVLPVGALAFAVAKLISRDLKLPIIKIIAAFWLILSLLHIFIFNPTSMRNEAGEEEAKNIIIDVFSQGRASGGGFFGMIVGLPANSLLGIGAPIAIIAAIIVLIVLITGRSFVNFVGQGVGKARDYYEEARRNDIERFENDAEDDVPENVIKIGPRVRDEKRNEKPKKGNFVEFEKPEETNVIQLPQKIMLVNEEVDTGPKKTNPLFAPRPVVPETSHKDKRVDIISFPATISGESAHSSAEQTHDEEFQFPEDAYNYNYFKENVSDEAIILPVEDIDYSAGPVVKGLIEGGEQSEMTPLFGDDGDDLLEYDEFAAYANSTKKSAMPAINIENPSHTYENYQLPSLNLLSKNERATVSAESRTQIMENSRILEETLRSFKIESKVVEVSVGPTVTRYDLSPGTGVKVSSILNLSNDLALNLAAQGLRIEAPVPGKSAVGIEIPNKEPQGVFLREILEDERFLNFPSKLAFAVGKDIAGSPIITDITRMPHLLIAGATGSGKSVCINTLITSLLYKARPDEVKLLMIDPKVVELSVYNGIPHLLIPVVTDPKKASGALSWAVAEMETRYGMFAESGCRDLKGYNKFAEQSGEPELPQIVIVIDELADLMMACKGEVEEAICRLAQKARAAGIHLIVATQRPSVDVITGLIKANIPSRLAFMVSSGIDSRTVLDMYGAEKLLGKGDMLFLPMGQNKPIRVQGGFIRSEER